MALVVLPATASAVNDPQLTNSGGGLVAVGTGDLKATQVGTTGILTTEGTKLFECTTGTGTGTVIKNSGGTVEGELTSVVIGGTGPKAATEPANECTSSVLGNISVTPVLPVCLRSTPTMNNDEMQMRGGKCSAEPKSLEFIIVSTTIGECKYGRATPMKADFTTTPEDARATIRSTPEGSGLSKTSGGFLCPTSVMVEGTRTLEDEAGNPLFVS
ncbi:MAG: hypothetical protein ACTHNY_02515 [Solirubrobacterales bacterium]